MIIHFVFFPQQLLSACFLYFLSPKCFVQFFPLNVNCVDNYSHIFLTKPSSQYLLINFLSLNMYCELKEHQGQQRRKHVNYWILHSQSHGMNHHNWKSRKMISFYFTDLNTDVQSPWQSWNFKPFMPCLFCEMCILLHCLPSGNTFSTLRALNIPRTWSLFWDTALKSWFSIGRYSRGAMPHSS